MKLKVLSWNIWINSYFDEVQDFLKNNQADIIGLQEVRADDPARQTIEFLTELGYQHAFAPVEKTWDGKMWKDGPAIFSKHNIIGSESYILSETDKRAAVKAEIEVGNKKLHVFSTHLIHNHQKQTEEQDFQADNLVKLLPKESTILMGDFNATPESGVVQKMQEVMINSDPSNTPTWSVYPEGCDYCNPQKIDTRLDYIFTTSDIKTSSPAVESSKGSDHLPISVEIEI